ncbi:MAG: Serine/threonine-protein kinase PknD [Acidobacteria bacterium]|nr:Serine/threonine-protein kinase PknD [Acidobacteriota bacterium]
MTPERWEKIGQLYTSALEMAPDDRAAFLEEACAGDEELRREVESLIAADAQAGDFIAAPVFGNSVDTLTEENIRSLVGRRFGDYEVLAFLGRGGMGEVYLARDPSLERRVALKLLLDDFTRDEARVRRFTQEAKAVSALNHPNIITIYEIGEADGRRYISTEFIEGQTLRRQLASERMTLPVAMDTAIQIAGALGAAHDAGIVHRDIKPENIMARPDGLVKVLDFGLAKLTERRTSISIFDTQASSAGFKTDPGMILGTVAYMSPEQVRGDDVDARSDIFSLGVVCYEMIAGRRPFIGETSSHVIVSILDKEPDPLPEAPDELQRIVGKALRKDRERRYQNAEDLLADLRALKQKLELQTEPTWDQSRQDKITAPDGDRKSARAADIRLNPASGGIRTTTRLMISAERLLHRLNIYKRVAAIAVTALIIVAIAAIFYFGHSPALTEKDTVLLADFVNQTGDEVFDSTLKQALAVQLEQSPFLSFFAEENIRETLRYMGRQPDERVTKELAREICQRQGVKALLIGSIARFDQRYSIILEAINSQSGATIASALAEADGKDQTLRALGKAATQLREKLGESLSSIKKFDAPIEQATTPSLDALKAWSRGVEMARSGKSPEAIPFYKHAKELDPNFAKADVSLSVAYINLGLLDLSAEHAARAFALRDRVTEREKFDITGNYHALATGDLFKAIEAVEIWKQTYPRDYGPRSRLASLYRLIGRFDDALAAAREANQLNPRATVPYVTLGNSFIQLNRFDEARAIIERGLQQQLSTATSHRDLFYIGLIKGDSAMMKLQLDWAAGKSDEYWALHWQSQSESFAGRLTRARDYYRRAAELAARSRPERAAWFVEESALRSAVCGLCQQAKADGARADASSRISLQSYVPITASRALALALCGETGRAQSLANDALEDNPQSTLANVVWLPVIRAAIELRRGDPDQAIHSLQPVADYEQAALFWPTYLRGLAHLHRKSGAEAASEFQKIIAHRGWDPASPLWPLAHLGLARAAALTGDAARSRQAYENFFALWKDADPDLPVLIEAKQEYAKLKTEP